MHVSSLLVSALSIFIAGAAALPTNTTTNAAGDEVVLQARRCRTKFQVIGNDPNNCMGDDKYFFCGTQQECQVQMGQAQDAFYWSCKVATIFTGGGSACKLVKWAGTPPCPPDGCRCYQSWEDCIQL
ncbi:hypothetical protein HDV05_000361 [Chytridiales sp. JEL 0842]|nr:hypothetical protein HDV05_000361 [Chytridiales sp. JEL 0842]